MNGWKSIAILWVVFMPCPALYAQSNDDVLSARVDEAVRAQMQEQRIPGVSLGVMRDGRIVKATGYGLANLELNVPVTPASVFHTESMGKVFTAVGVMMLVQEGKVGLDEKISTYLSETPRTWEKVTIRHLLTHTSGIPDYAGNEGVMDIGVINLRQDYTEEELVAKFATLPLNFQPGERRNYTNSGYVVLGVVIHRVTGKFWFDFLQERIFGPLGMISTRLISEADIIPNRVSGYRLENGQWKNPQWIAPSLNTTADGTLYTNIPDLAKWDAALYSEKLLSRSSLDQLWSPVKLNSGKLYQEGFGWILSEVNGHRLVWKDGANDPFTTVMSRYLDDHLTVVVLTNLGGDGSVPKRIADEVAAIYQPALKVSTSEKQK